MAKAATSRQRRRLLRAGLALPAALWPFATRAATTPTCDQTTPARTAGPFYTPDTPLKSDFRPDDPAGKPLALRATVLDMHCRPLESAIVDLWHADSRGAYDNDGFRLRGHQRADLNGHVRFDTVVPGRYPGRTRHFHVRIFRPEGGRLLTTQLYFPGEETNAGDDLFVPDLLLEFRNGEARYTFVVDA